MAHDPDVETLKAIHAKGGACDQATEKIYARIGRIENKLAWAGGVVAIVAFFAPLIWRNPAPTESNAEVKAEIKSLEKRVATICGPAEKVQ